MVRNYKFKDSVGETEVKLPKPTEDLVYFNKNGVELTRNSESENGNYFFFLKDITIDYTPVARIIGKLEKTQDGEVLKITQIDQLPGRRGALILALNKVPDLPIRDVLIEHFGISDNELDNAKQLYENGSNAGERRTDFYVGSEERRIEARLRQTLESSILGLTISKAKKLGIPVTSNVRELRKNFILFTTTPNMIKNANDNIIEVEYLKKAILAALESNQKIVLAYEALSDPSLKKVLNDPKMLKHLMDKGVFPEIVKKELDVFIEIEEIYGDRFEIEPIGVPKNDMETLSKEELETYNRRIIVEEALDLFKKYKDNITVLFYTDDGINPRKTYIYERDKDTPAVLFYIDAINVGNILDAIEKNIENGGINKEDTAEICVFVPPKNQDLHGAMRRE